MTNAGTDPILCRAHELAEEVAHRGRATGKPSVFGLTCTANRNNLPVYFSTARDTAESVGCSAIFGRADYGPTIARTVDGLVDYVLLDVEGKLAGWPQTVSEVRGAIRRSRLLTYQPNDMTARAADALLAECGIIPDGRPVAVLGAGHVGARIAQRLVERGHLVRIWRRDEATAAAICTGLNAMRGAATSGRVEVAPDIATACRGAWAVLGCTPGVAVITPKIIERLPHDVLILDVGNGTLMPEAIQLAHQRDLRVLCLDIRAAYEGEIAMLLHIAEQVRSRIGRRPQGVATVISGGVLGRRGDIIVDNYADPRCIIGIADGCGDIIVETDDPAWGQALASVKADIEHRKGRERFCRQRRPTA